MSHPGSPGRTDCLGTTRDHVFWDGTTRHMLLSVYGFFLMKALIWMSKVSFALIFGNNTSSSPVRACVQLCHTVAMVFPTPACWSLAFFLASSMWKSSMQQGLPTHMVRNPPICSLTRYIHSFSSHSFWPKGDLASFWVLPCSAATEEMNKCPLRTQKLL